MTPSPLGGSCIVVECVSRVSVFPVSVRVSTTSEASLRAGTLALVTLIPLLAGSHHAFFADLLGRSLSTIRLAHRSVGFIMSLIYLLHILVAVASQGSL
jgi:hypothetical protein